MPYSAECLPRGEQTGAHRPNRDVENCREFGVGLTLNLTKPQQATLFHGEAIESLGNDGIVLHPNRG